MSGQEDSYGGDPLGRLRSRQLGPVAVRALAALALVIAIVAALLAWRARPTVEPLGPGEPASQDALAAPAGPAASQTQGTVVVAVSGRVRHPGLVELPAGSRVADAIEAAGGAVSTDDITLLNLARQVSDGELILVGVTPPPQATGGSDGARGGLPVNLNTATSAQLQALPGVGPVLADRIIAYREKTGGFRSVGDLKSVSGIGEARYAELKDLVTV